MPGRQQQPGRNILDRHGRRLHLTRRKLLQKMPELRESPAQQHLPGPPAKQQPLQQGRRAHVFGLHGYLRRPATQHLRRNAPSLRSGIALLAQRQVDHIERRRHHPGVRDLHRLQVEQIENARPHIGRHKREHAAPGHHVIPDAQLLQQATQQRAGLHAEPRSPVGRHLLPEPAHQPGNEPPHALQIGRHVRLRFHVSGIELQRLRMARQQCLKRLRAIAARRVEPKMLVCGNLSRPGHARCHDRRFLPDRMFLESAGTHFFLNATAVSATGRPAAASDRRAVQHRRSAPPPARP